MRTGIAQNSERRTVSGANVNFDRRKTSEVDATRDPANRKGQDKRLQR